MTTSFDSQHFLKNLTTQAGVYQMLDEAKAVLYVGKAKNLKKRLSSYFQKRHDNIKTQLLVQKIHSIDITITHNETEALLLENSLIKKHLPRFNVIFRDDKSYPYLFISTRDLYPRLEFHRGARKQQGQYFGPYPSAYAVRENLRLLQKLFKLRNCNNHYFAMRSRPCMQYQIKRCTAPCVGYISSEDYATDVNNAILFLQGKAKSILDELAIKMEKASTELQFELAAHFRNQISRLRKLQEQQAVVDTRDKEMDVIVVSQAYSIFAVQVLMIRGGLVLGNKTYFPKVPANTTEVEVLEAFLSQYYLVASDRLIPAKIILNLPLQEQKELMTAFSQKAGYAVRIQHRVKAERSRLLMMAESNVKQALVMQLSDKSTHFQRFLQLQVALNLPETPKKLACFDISHTGGEETVASYVVFNQEGPLKAEYRRLIIKGITPGDDYAAMKQAVERRFERLIPEHRPDILLIDGGLGQLHQAEQVFSTLNIHDVILMGVAKGRERKSGKETLWLSGREAPLSIESTSPGFHLIQHVRDEAHRFAITGHRLRRDKKRKTSELEHIVGIGPKRRKALLNHFGGWQEIRNASIEDLAKAPGMSRSLAEKVYNGCR